MQILWRTLLLIALCVQLPLASFAAYPSESQHDSHHHAVVSDGAMAHHHEAHADQDPAGVADDCAAVHHCTGTHVQAISSSQIQIHIGTLGQIFSLNTEALPTSGLLPSIERPKWANI